MADMRTDLFYVSIAFFELSHYPDDKTSTGYRKDIVYKRTVPDTDKLSYNSSDNAPDNTENGIYPETVVTIHDFSGNIADQCTNQNINYQ